LHLVATYPVDADVVESRRHKVDSGTAEWWRDDWLSPVGKLAGVERALPGTALHLRHGRAVGCGQPEDERHGYISRCSRNHSYVSGVQRHGGDGGTHASLLYEAVHARDDLLKACTERRRVVVETE